MTGIAEVGSPPEDVGHDLSALINEITDFKGTETLRAAAYLHARFEYIHPFADGNGRVGRALLNYYLMTRDHPPIIIYDEDKRGYYNALASYDMTEEIDPLSDFLKTQTEKTWVKALEREKKREQG